MPDLAYAGEELGLPSGGPFFVRNRLNCRHPEVSAVINVVRMHCYRQGVLHVEHCDRKDAKRRRTELSQQGYVITHTELL